MIALWKHSNSTGKCYFLDKNTNLNTHRRGRASLRENKRFGERLRELFRFHLKLASSATNAGLAIQQRLVANCIL